MAGRCPAQDGLGERTARTLDSRVLNSYSAANGDRPHPDLASVFADERSCYVYDVSGLNDALVDFFGKDFTDEFEEFSFFTRSHGRWQKYLRPRMGTDS